jgi:hypothetical protein
MLKRRHVACQRVRQVLVYDGSLGERPAQPVTRQRAVMAIQPLTQLGLLWSAVPDNRDVPVRQKPRLLVVQDLNPTSRRPSGYGASR